MTLGAVNFADLSCRKRFIAMYEDGYSRGIAADDFLGLFEVGGVLVHGHDRRAGHGNALFAGDAYPRVLVVSRDADEIDCESSFGRWPDAYGVTNDRNDVGKALFREDELPAVYR